MTVKVIPLNNGGVTLVDAQDWERVHHHRWFGHMMGSERFYAMATIGGRRVYLHRLLLEPGAGMEVDHINGDSLDNRRSNLRVVTHQENLANRRRGYGVTGERNIYVARSGRYAVKLKVRGRRIQVGTFSTLPDAVDAASAARAAHFGGAS